MKRFILLAGEDHETAGGMNDYAGSFDSEHRALAAVDAVLNSDRPGRAAWWHVFDTRHLVVVATSKNNRADVDPEKSAWRC